MNVQREEMSQSLENLASEYGAEVLESHVDYYDKQGYLVSLKMKTPTSHVTLYTGGKDPEVVIASVRETLKKYYT